MPRLELIFLRSESGDGFDVVGDADWWTGYVCKDRFSLARAVMKPPLCSGLTEQRTEDQQ
jgi:hypothetical protein